MGLPIRKKQPVILNSKGQPVKLSIHEQYHAQYMQRMVNARFGNSLGYEVPITTLTTVVKKISEQKFFEIAPADYVPMVVGQGTWGSNLTTYRSFVSGDLFESGIINTGADNSRLSSVQAGVDSLNIKIENWAKEYGWTIFDLEEAAKSGNWDVVSAKEESRKTNWDLGIQRIAFLGAQGLNGAGGSCLGLLNQPGITFNTTVITKAISAMSYTELAAFQLAIIEKYRANCNRTAFPTHFAIPETDYNGLIAQSSPQFPMKSTLQLLEEGFQVICRNKNFKILPVAYASAANAGGALPALAATSLYCLYKYDEKSVVMNVPLKYTSTLAMSLNNFQFQNAAYGQFTGVLSLRPQEMLYLGY